VDISNKAPFAAYKGNAPYIFVSYAHKNSAAIYTHLIKLNDQGFRVWYDEGVDPGTEWPEEIAKAIDKCACFLVFITPEAVKSENVRKEINFALLKKKNIICIHIKETVLPAGLELQLSSLQAILEFRIQQKDTYFEKLFQALPPETKGPYAAPVFIKKKATGLLDRRFLNISITAIALIAAGIIGYFGFFTDALRPLLPTVTQTYVKPTYTAPTPTPAPYAVPVGITGVFSGKLSSASYLIDSSGVLWSWGYNGNGQLGDGTRSDSRKPLKVLESVTTVTVDSNRVFALKKDSSLWAWGAKPLGNGLDQDSNEPIKIADGVKLVSSENEHAMMLKEDGSLWEWGNMTASYLTPVKLMDGVKSMAAGQNRSYVVKEDGSLWAWGNLSYDLPDLDEKNNKIDKNATKPIKILDNVRSVSAGISHAMALKEDGSLWVWGSNAFGQLGDGTTNTRPTPQIVLDNVQSMVCGYEYSLAVKTDGSLWAWGYNWFGQLGDGSVKDHLLPIQVMDGVKSVAAGYHHTMVLKADGSLWAWGDNWFGQLGNGMMEDSLSALQIFDGKSAMADPKPSVPFASEMTATICGSIPWQNRYLSFYKIDKDGALWAWGDNSFGQLGDGTTNDSRKPVKVLDGVKSAVSGGTHVLATKDDGSVWAWGCNEQGQLGDSTTGNSLSPKKIMDDADTVTAGFASSGAIKKDGSLWVWGDAFNYGSTPTIVMENVASANFSFKQAVVLTKDGNVWKWGAYLGNGTTDYAQTPVWVMDSVKSIAIGTATYAIKNDGSLWTWGFNNTGLVGDGTTNDSLKPKEIMQGVKTIGASMNNAMALKADGSLWTWGVNGYGQLGDATNESSSSPKKVLDGVQSVIVEDGFAIAALKDGSVWAWGNNDLGQLGDGTTISRSSPVKVTD
jgi:alpha-tubulin suppressor-like RCC1 family protein